MNWLDLAILAVIALSIVISLVRGFVRETLSLAVWIAAIWIGLRFAEPVAVLMEGVIASPTLRIGAAFAVLFVGVLIAGGILGYFASLLVGRTGLSGTDRFIGLFFGLARGVLVIAVLMLAAGLTALPREAWWQDSVLVEQLTPWVCRVGVEDWLDGRTFRAPIGDATAQTDAASAAEYWSDFCRDERDIEVDAVDDETPPESEMPD
ncbi:CvpA family protein [Methylonatrum kenyense]|uniref:CvpA family protein n=1 Tax=Methylonatrum kenyense TaxID=455253 RepID=UPI0020C1134D|nr:CvpA family protein [Methylonatrum kenyense]MCK8514848.1 CvpA family protein [Methylonatrum kenyense]